MTVSTIVVSAKSPTLNDTCTALSFKVWATDQQQQKCLGPQKQRLSGPIPGFSQNPHFNRSPGGPLSSLRSTASEEKGPAQQLPVQDGRFLWGVAWRRFPPPGPHTEAPLSACPSRLVQKGACLRPRSSLGSHNALRGLLLR